VLCYILSHINALGIPSAQIALLKAVEAISDSAKAQILFPTIQRLLSTPAAIAKGSDPQRAELSDLVVSCLDISVTNDLNDEKHMLWDLFVAVLRATLKSGSFLRRRYGGVVLTETIGLLSSSRRVISQTLEHGLFAKLRLERKIAICEALLDISSSDAEAVSDHMVLYLVSAESFQNSMPPVNKF
jgi:U3 small nucleolar RNA-associated protein 10